MSRRISQSASSNLYDTSKKYNSEKSRVGIVVDVILDENSERMPTTELPDFKNGKHTGFIGACVIREQTEQTVGEDSLILYKPYDPFNISIPLIGESVEIISVGNNKYYRRLNTGKLNTGNARENANKRAYPDVEKPSNTAKSYSNIATTGISNSANSGTRDTKIGKYFKETQSNPLFFYEGDKLIQSRFGQSIRFSGYNNPNNEFAPTIHIRNRQGDTSLNQLGLRDLTEEDVNDDGSTILMSSGNYLIPFRPGPSGGTFETKPEVFADYPSELKGTDQVLINSGRIILSSKDSEMIFYSKGNYGFISDGVFSIDNGKEGANMNFNGDVRITTNDNNFYVLGDSGNIYLNIENKDEPLVRGNTLKELLEKLIDLIVRQVYQTPSGPTAVGPTNQADFKKLRSELSTMLSTLNFTE